MISAFWVTGILLLSCSLRVTGQFRGENSGKFDLVYHKKGNLSVTGIFSQYCNLKNARDLEEISAAIWVTEALNHFGYLPGITIGMKIFRTCVDDVIFEKELEELMEYQNDADTISVGILTTKGFQKNLKISKDIDANRLIQVQSIISEELLVDLTVQLLRNLQWMIVDLVVAESETVLSSFSVQSSNEKIRVREELLINGKINPGFGNLNETSVIVILATFSAISELPEALYNKTNRLILVPTDFAFAPVSGLPKNAIVLLPSTESEDVLSEFIEKRRHQMEFFNHKGPVKSPIFIDIAVNILNSLKPFRRLQEKYCEDINFNSKQPCVKFLEFIEDLKNNKTVLEPRKSIAVSPDDIENVLQVLKIEPSSNDEMFLCISFSINDNANEDLAVFQIFNKKANSFQSILLMLNDNLLSDRQIVNKSEVNSEYRKQIFQSGLEEIEEFSDRKTDLQIFLVKLLQSLRNSSMLHSPDKSNEITEDAISVKNTLKEICDFFINSSQLYSLCQNFEKNLDQRNAGNETTANHPRVVWRFSTWVSINTCVGLAGVVCTSSIMVFIITRICKGDILEGSPYFTISMMIAVILVFISSFPFHMNPPVSKHLICSFRINAPPLAYAILFSLLLSRSIMLACSEGGNGFVNHLNGYLQSILCFFILGIQVSLLAQNWVYKEGSLELDCSLAQDKNKIMLGLTYDFLLLIFLACLSPFIIRSKRNYKEGMLFSVAVFFTGIVWSAWICLYFLLAEGENDAAMAMGLNSTALVFIICIFIPRTYQMAASVAREQTGRSLPPLDQNILSNVTESHYKSSTALNESVFGTVTYKNCETGVENTNFYSDRLAEESRGSREENVSRESILLELPNRAN